MNKDNLIGQSVLSAEQDAPSIQVSTTIFRVVGGFIRQNTMEKYQIVPYLLIRQTERNWYVSRNGKYTTEKKQGTKNTEFFLDIEQALQCILNKIDIARESIHHSLEKAGDTMFRTNLNNSVYTTNFKDELFEPIQQFTIVNETKKAIRVIEPTGMRGSKVFKDKNGKVTKTFYYLYRNKSQPHNPNIPFERWISKDLSILISLVRKYGEDRLKYLHTTKMRLIDWVRLYEREREF